MRRVLRAELDRGEGAKAVDDLLRLVVVLRDKRGAPEAAQALRDLLRGEPDVLEMLRPRRKRGRGIDEVRRFTRKEGRGEVLRAPPQATPEAPQGTRQLKTLFDPLQQDRARQIARRREEIQDGSRQRIGLTKQ